MTRRKVIMLILGTALSVNLISCEDMTEFGQGADPVDIYASTVFKQDAYIKASNADTQDQFGYGVDFDGTTLVVSAPGEASRSIQIINADGQADSDNTSPGPGAAYVFRQNRKGEWFQDAYIKPLATHFEESIAVKGDLIALCDYSAVVSLYRRNNDGNWFLESTIYAPNSVGVLTSSSIAIGSDFIAIGSTGNSSAASTISNTDGYIYNDTGSQASGAVFIYKKNISGWYLDAMIKPSTNASNSRFGHKVVADGNRIAVGSMFYVPSAYTYVCDEAGNWYEETKITPPSPNADDQFGWSISLAGDDLAISAPKDDSGAKTCINGGDGISSDDSMTDSGAVYMFHREYGTWNQTAYLKPSNNNCAMQFGFNVKLDGRFLAVSGYAEENQCVEIINQQGSAVENLRSPASGAVYLFAREVTGEWVQKSYIKPSNSMAGQNFGYGLAMKNAILVVGACGESSGTRSIVNTDGSAPNNLSFPNAGAVYIFNNR